MLPQHTQSSTALNNQELQAQQAVLNPNLHLQVNALGCFFLIFALITSYLLYGSFGHTETEIFTYRLMGILLCLAGALMLRLSYTLWTNGNEVLSVFAVILYLCLFAIEWSTTLGFTAVSQTHVKENSGAALIVKEQSKIADTKLDQLAQYQGLSVPELQRKVDNLNQKINDAQAALTACPSGYFSKCINPKQAEIKTLENALALATQDLSNANKYQHALTQKEQSLSMASNPESLESSYHPLFKVQSKLFETTPNDMESKYLGFSSLIATTLTSILFLMASVLKQRFAIVPIANKKTPQSTNNKSLRELAQEKIEQALTVKKQ